MYKQRLHDWRVTKNRPRRQSQVSAPCQKPDGKSLRGLNGMPLVAHDGKGGVGLVFDERLDAAVTRTHVPQELHGQDLEPTCAGTGSGAHGLNGSRPGGTSCKHSEMNECKSSVLGAVAKLLVSLRDEAHHPSSRSTPEPPQSTVTSDHLDIYRGFESKLYPELRLRGNLKNGQDMRLSEDKETNAKAATAIQEGFDFVERIVRDFHCGVAVGILATFDRLHLRDISVCLSQLLVQHSSRALGQHHDFTMMVQCLNHMAENVEYQDFRAQIHDLCLGAAEVVHGVFGPTSLAGMYLMALSGVAHVGKTALNVLLLRGVSYVKEAYPNDWKLILGFSYYAVGTLSRVDPASDNTMKAATSLFSEASAFHQQMASNSQEDSRTALWYVNRSLYFISKCCHARAEKDNDSKEFDNALQTLLDASLCHTKWAAEGKNKDFFGERLISKAKEWCNGPGDDTKIDEVRQQIQDLQVARVSLINPVLKDYLDRPLTCRFKESG
jgi:hypothetical protein